MDNSSINTRFKACKKHNQPILYYDQNGRNPLCQACLLEKGKLITFEQIQKQYQEKIIINNKENDFQLQWLYSMKDEILKYKEKIITTLDKSIQQIIDQINNIQQQKQSIQQLDIIMDLYESIEDFINFLNNNQKNNRQSRNQIIKNLLLELKQNIMKIDFLQSTLNQKQQISLQSVLSKNVQISEVTFDNKQRHQQIEYKLIQQVKIESRVHVFTIDQKNNILIAGRQDGMVKIYDFQNGKVGAQIQSLKAHSKYVYCILCMKNTHGFVSGSGDNQIIIWCFDKFNKWMVQQTLNGHLQSVYCIIMNSKEDQLISGSVDGIVKFWRKLADSWNMSQTVDTGNTIQALSLNENEDKLIMCQTQCATVIVMNNQSNQVWKIAQEIKVDEFPYRLSFTIQNQFVFQPLTADYLTVYDFDETQNQFKQKTKVEMKNVSKKSNNLFQFPCTYVKKLAILTLKQHQFVNIFKVNQNGEYQLIQSIDQQTIYFNGMMTNDGEYLITYDSESNQIQVRKLKLQEGLS